MPKSNAKVTKEVQENVWITLTNLDRYKKQSDAQLDEKIQKINTQIEQNTARLFVGTKDSLDKADVDVINEYFTAHTDVTPRTGDVFVITTTVDGKEYEKSSYTYNVDDWEAITGNVDASKVIFREDIVLAGNFTQIGNLKKDLDGTAKFGINGKSVTEAFIEMCSQKLQPNAPTQPAVSGFALSGAKAVEAGTPVAEASFGTAKLSAGSYQYGPATGVTAQSYTVDRVCVPSSLSATGVATEASGTDNNGGAGFIIGDGSEENVVSSLKYKVTVAHNEGVVAWDNFEKNSDPEVKIEAGNKTQETSAYTPFRKFFYGATADKPTVDSAYVRGLTHSTAAYKAQTLTLNVAAGTTRVAIACIASAKGVTKVINETALNADVTGTFVKSTVSVEGANGYTAKDYNIWIFEPAEAYGQAATLKVTLG